MITNTVTIVSETPIMQPLLLMNLGNPGSFIPMTFRGCKISSFDF